MDSNRVEAILAFWFGPVPGENRKEWFQKNSEFDAQIQRLFIEDYELAATGQFRDWLITARSCLAIIVLMDQFPRNMFRGNSRSFETDPYALSAAQHAVENGFDQEVNPIERFFIYLPFEHSENLDHQHRSVQLFEVLVDEAPHLQHCLDYAIRHRDVIQRFGRYPHRNQILDRPSTEAEVEFLKQPGSRF